MVATISTVALAVENKASSIPTSPVKPKRTLTIQ